MSETQEVTGPEVAHAGAQIRVAEAVNAGTPRAEGRRAIERLVELEGRLSRESAALDRAEPCDFDEFTEVWFLRAILCHRQGAFDGRWSLHQNNLMRYHEALLRHRSLDEALRTVDPDERLDAEAAWRIFGQTVGVAPDEVGELVRRALLPVSTSSGLGDSIRDEVARAELSGMPDQIIREHESVAMRWDTHQLRALIEAVKRDGMTDTPEDRLRFVRRDHAGDDFMIQRTCQMEELRRGLVPDENAALRYSVRDVVRGRYRGQLSGLGGGSSPPGEKTSDRIDLLAEDDREIATISSASPAELRQARLAVTSRLDDAEFRGREDMWAPVSRLRLKRQPDLPRLCADAARLVVWHDRQLRLRAGGTPSGRATPRSDAPAVFSRQFRSALRLVDRDRYPTAESADIWRDVPRACFLLIMAARSARKENLPERVVGHLLEIEVRGQIAYLETARRQIDDLIATNSSPELVITYVQEVCAEWDEIRMRSVLGTEYRHLATLHSLCSPYFSKLLPHLGDWTRISHERAYTPLMGALSRFASALTADGTALAVIRLGLVVPRWTSARDEADPAKIARHVGDICAALRLAAVVVNSANRFRDVLDDPALGGADQLTVIVADLLAAEVIANEKAWPQWSPGTRERVVSAVNALRDAARGDASDPELVSAIFEGEDE